MSNEIVKFEVNKPISLENASDIKEEFHDSYYQDNKVCISETTITDTINISNCELNAYIKNDEIRKYETLSPNHMKTDLPSSMINDPVSNNVKIEDEFCPANIQTKFDNEQLFCNHCHEVYQDYCTKCRVLVHILNKNHNTYDSVKELPKYMLEAKESIGHLGIFSLKVIPEDVRFGPFTGLNSTALPLTIKGGRFVASDDQSEHLNWMQYINPARNIYEQNLFPFQYDDKLYYCTTRRIQEGEELLVYFGKEYEDNLLKNVEMDFVPITKKNVENVFGCTFCCLGFSSKEYLAEHKAVSHCKMKEMFSVQELTQCQFCKMYLEAKEYFDHHMDYCCERNDRYCIVPIPEVHGLEVEKRASDTHETKKWKRGLYKCTQCKFRTMYNADLRQHTNEHYEVKVYKCGICHRRYNAKESLKAHVERNHANNEAREIEKYTTRDCFKANVAMVKERSPHPHDERQHQCTKCKYQTSEKCHLKSLVKMKHPTRGKYKCANCEFKTCYRAYLGRHMKLKHLMISHYKCMVCEFKTNYKSSLVRHKNAKHLKAMNYRCKECEYKTNSNSHLKVHIKTKHLKEKDYKCSECEYKAIYKSHLEEHIKAKHLKQKDYECKECEYKTNYKSNLKAHVKAKHFKENDYKCTDCEFKTNYKSSLEMHVKAKHLKQNNYKCTECEFKANHKSNLQVHIKAKHLKQKNYECMKCEFKTYYKYSLEAHIKAKHLKEIDYKCTECEHMTSRKSDLEKHIKTKHLKQNDYKCTECEFKTYYKSSLEAHIKAKHLKENDYKCTVCEYRTYYKSNLEAHTRAKHLKQNEYKCMDCDFKTYYKSNLEKHIKTHL